MQNGCKETPFLLVGAKELPRGALVEFQVNLHTGWRSEEGAVPMGGDDESDPVAEGAGEDDVEEASWEDEDDEDDDELEAVYESGVYGKEGRWESCRTSGKKERGSRLMVFLDRELTPFLTISERATDE
jgi:diphthine-ammonia ligase